MLAQLDRIRLHSFEEWNRLTTERANDLVYVLTNMRLGKRSTRAELFAEGGRGLKMTQDGREEVD